jgi:hypothetical protein
MVNHQVMTAKPLMDLFRAMFGAMLADTDTRKSFSDVQLRAFEGVLSQINSRYNVLANRRNDLLHGTWIIPDVQDPNSDVIEFIVSKLKTHAGGLKQADDLPKNAKELCDLSARCRDLTKWIQLVTGCWGFQTNPGSGAHIDKIFKYDAQKDEWTLAI